jgi:YHS domain-containing protein
MGFLGRVVRFLFWVLILSWAVKLLGRILGGMDGEQPPSGGDAAGRDEPEVRAKRLVKDPVCGVHMSEELALPVSANGETQYFCSEQCRAKYEDSVLRRAANA